MEINIGDNVVFEGELYQVLLIEENGGELYLGLSCGYCIPMKDVERI